VRHQVLGLGASKSESEVVLQQNNVTADQQSTDINNRLAKAQCPSVEGYEFQVKDQDRIPWDQAWKPAIA